MSKVKFELNRAGVAELLKSQKMAEICEEYASKVVSGAGDGYEATTQVKSTRVVSRVAAATPHAYYSNLKHNTLLKALGGARS